MTVQEVIEALSKHPMDANVYVPDYTGAGTAEIAKTVCVLEHFNLPKGITIPNDVCITPWEHGQVMTRRGVVR